MNDPEEAPGGPGIPARWTSSAKSGVGTALGEHGRVWFTISHGILNEIYYPRADQACTRDLGLVITGPEGFLAEEKRQAVHEVTTPTDGIPAFHLTSRCPDDRYAIEKTIIADPKREVVLQRVQFRALQGSLEDYGLYALLAPHLGNAGAGNTAWVGECKGIPMLFAERDGTALALACSTDWLARSVGFVGTSDGWQQLRAVHRLMPQHSRATNGNVALTGQIDLVATGGAFTLAVGFGRTASEAGHRVAASLWDGFDEAFTEYTAAWRDWQATLAAPPTVRAGTRDLYRVSTAVLLTHESARFPGGMIASLSIPWGYAKGDHDLGGYHLAWPRDLVESAGGLLAAGAHEDVHRVLRYLAVTQEPDGRWPQNMWLDGTPYWPGIQMDETGLPILLVDLAHRHGAITDLVHAQLWSMVRRAAAFIVQHGPVTEQDRWEEESGYSVYTLAVEVAALLAAAEFAERYEPEVAEYLRETADAWNASIEQWTYVEGTALAQEVGVEGYYVRITPDDVASPLEGSIQLNNRAPGEGMVATADLVSPDALALVRFGLRAADDPRIVNTVKVIDAKLKIELPQGPVWYRYNGDGYGEHADGSAFNGVGIGRPWPLLIGERAHYEIAAGRLDVAADLLEVYGNFANAGGLLPEQVWDQDDVPRRELYRGKPSGSAMPLVWAHAEYLKLRHSLADGAVFDMPPQPVERYHQDHPGTPFACWRFDRRASTMSAGLILRIEVRAAATLHWSIDGWATTHDTPARATGLGIHLIDLPTGNLPADTHVDFTMHWHDADQWEGQDFRTSIIPATPSTP
ncbi:MAG: glucan 1,4-alpha-glucosidase [Gemmatimonadota bacterium]